MRKTTRSLTSLLALMLAMSLFACSTARHQDGFSYRPLQAGPDMGSGEPETELATKGTPVTAPEEQAIAEVKAMPPATTLDAVQQEKWDDLIETGLRVSDEGGKDFRTDVRSIAGNYALNHDIRFSGKQLEKLDRISAKMEKKYMKQKGPDGGFGPSNNLEWAILGAAAVGLFIGIFGAGFGWVIFLVAALAYLYFKLLHKK
jgi:hypothetical protein